MAISKGLFLYDKIYNFFLKKPLKKEQGCLIFKWGGYRVKHTAWW